MYVTKMLFNAINESYYRNFQKSDMKPLPKDFQIQDILDMMTIVRSFDKTEQSESMYNMLYDLRQVTRGLEPIDSTIGCKAYREFTKASERVYSVITKSSDITRQVISILRYLSPNSALVGGCVRDSLLGLEPKDFDFATSTSMDVLKKEFIEKGFDVDEVGLHFLVMVVSKRNDQGESEQFEIAGFRKDVYRKKPKYVRKISHSIS